MNPLSEKVYDAIIIGAGHNGLTAAAYLARAGYATLVVERRDIVGRCCVTEEIAPDCRASTTRYIASLLRPDVIRDLRLANNGLRMIPCDPALQVPFPDGQLVSWWAKREEVVEELRKISPKDAETFVRIDQQLKRLASGTETGRRDGKSVVPPGLLFMPGASWRLMGGATNILMQVVVDMLRSY